MTVATVRAGSVAVCAALTAAASAGQTLVICDAAVDEDLVTLGTAAAGMPFFTGGSGIAIGLSSNFIRSGLARGGASHFAGVDGPEAILAGSCSTATRQRHTCKKPSGPGRSTWDAIMTGRLGVAEILDFVTAHHGRGPLVYSTDDPSDVEEFQRLYGRERLARTLDGLFADTARALVVSGVRRLVVAGGETSGAVV